VLKVCQNLFSLKTELPSNKYLLLCLLPVAVKDEPTENNSEIAAKKSKLNTDESKKVDETSKPVAPNAPAKKVTKVRKILFKYKIMREKVTLKNLDLIELNFFLLKL
jgi:hypothetical protein